MSGQELVLSPSVEWDQVCQNGMVLFVFWLMMFLIHREEEKKKEETEQFRVRWLRELQEKAMARIHQHQSIHSFSVHSDKMEYVLKHELPAFLHVRQYQRSLQQHRLLVDRFSEEWMQWYPKIMKRTYQVDVFAFRLDDGTTEKWNPTPKEQTFYENKEVPWHFYHEPIDPILFWWKEERKDCTVECTLKKIYIPYYDRNDGFLHGPNAKKIVWITGETQPPDYPVNGQTIWTFQR